MRGKGETYSYITAVNTVLAVINVIVFFVMELLGDTTDAYYLLAHGAMYPYSVIIDGEWYRLLTSAFIHIGFSHLLNNMIMLICLGSYLERALGKIKYIIFYAAAAMGSNLIAMYIHLYTGDISVSAGASGVIFAIIGALLWLILRGRGRYANLPISRFAVMIVLSLYYGFTSVNVDNWAHIGGLLIGFIAGIILAPMGAKRERV